jgi:hypothetical protein
VVKVVKVTSPARLKVVKIRFAIFWRLFEGRICKKDIMDTNRVVAIDLKREEAIVLMDRNDQMWEIFKNKKGRHIVRRLRDRTEKDKQTFP